MKIGQFFHRHLLGMGLLTLAALTACGGGTSGSGLKTYEGRVLTPQGRSLSDVSVTIESTGDSSRTNSDGDFTIKSNAAGDEVPFLLEAPAFVSRFLLRNIPHESSRITLQVTVDPETDTSQVYNVNVRAWFAGLCDQYFENREIIRQANKVPHGTTCSLNVRVLEDGKPLSAVPIGLQYAACAAGSEWHTLKSVVSGSAQHAGAAEINFKFIDSNDYCRYRVVAPFEVPGSKPVFYPIDTFSEQEYFGK